MHEHRERYGRWSGNEKGVTANKKNCAAEVFDQKSMIPRQCAKRGGHGPNLVYCKQHAKKFDRRGSVNSSKISGLVKHD